MLAAVSSDGEGERVSGVEQGSRCGVDVFEAGLDVGMDDEHGLLDQGANPLHAVGVAQQRRFAIMGKL